MTEYRYTVTNQGEKMTAGAFSPGTFSFTTSGSVDDRRKPDYFLEKRQSKIAPGAVLLSVRHTSLLQEGESFSSGDTSLSL